MWVIRVDFVMSAVCRLYTQHQTFSELNGTSHLGQLQTLRLSRRLQARSAIRIWAKSGRELPSARWSGAIR